MFGLIYFAVYLANLIQDRDAGIIVYDNCAWKTCKHLTQIFMIKLYNKIRYYIVMRWSLHALHLLSTRKKNTLPPFLAASSSVLRETCKEICCNFTIGTLLERQLHFSDHIWDTAHTQSYSKSNWSKEVIFVAVHGRYRFFKMTTCRITRIIWIT